MAHLARPHVGAVYCALDAIAVETFRIELEPFRASFMVAATEGRARLFGVAELLMLSTWPSGLGAGAPFRDLLEHGRGRL